MTETQKPGFAIAANDLDDSEVEEVEDLPSGRLAGVLLRVVGGEVETGAVGGRGESRKLRLESGVEKEKR